MCAMAALLTVTLAANAAPDAHPMRFDHLTLDDGLSQSAVVSIWQDSAGFMWFGTENGLNRYNGYEFDHFKQERGNPDALRNDFIYDIGETADGALWIATNGGGLARFDRNTESFKGYDHDPADATTIAGDIVRTLLSDTDGGVWLGLRDSGLDRLDPVTGRFTHYALDGEAAVSVFALHLDSADRLWVGSDQGLYRLDKESGSVEAFRHDPAVAGSLSSNRVRTILEDSNGIVWIGTHGGGLNRFDADTGSFVHYRHNDSDPNSLGHDRVTAIFEDAEKRIWVGTSRGLNLLDAASGAFVRYNNESSDRNSLSGDAISTLFQDRSGLLWVGTLTSGVNKWNPKTWGLGLHVSETLAATADAKPKVTAFATDQSDTLWIGTFGDGLIARNRRDGSTTHYRHDPANPASLSDDRVMSVAMGRDGRVWAGTMRGGLNRLDPVSGAISIFRHDPSDPTSLSGDGIMALFEDSQGLLWVGTFGGGISIYDAATDSFTRHVADPSTPGTLGSPRVTGFAEDRHGNIWVGTDADGLNLFDRESGQFRSYRFDADNANSLSSDTVYSLHVDDNGTVWVGTRGGGLDRIIGSSRNPAGVTFRNLSQKDGLTNDVVYGVQSDTSGNLWVSTNYGITRINPATDEYKNLHRRDGLQSEEFNFGAHHKSGDGTLFFGGLNGYNEFKPAELPVSKVLPPIMLTGLFGPGDGTKAGLPDEHDDGVDLDYDDDSVTFEFAALDYVSSQHNRYMYKLEGFDQDWIDLGTHRRVTYTDLNDGNYLLRVKAANADGVWNEAGFALPVRVAAAPWDTWWAYLAYVGMLVQLGLFLWWGHQRKMRREEEYSERLEQEVKLRTSELAERGEELAQLNQTLQESSLSDPLTGLRNRRFVFEEVSRDLATIQRKYADEALGHNPSDAADLVFMMIDLDNFKPINDTYGHAAGDQMLLEIRDVLLSTCRRSDFVIRWGGDEFVIIAKQSNPGESEALAERIRHKISSSNFTLSEGQIVRTTASIGFVSYPLYSGHAETADLDDVINLADSLMYEAKRQRNAWVGLLGIDEAVTSEGFETGGIEPSSVLFRARRNGRLIEHDPMSERQVVMGVA